MKPKEAKFEREHELFRQELVNLIDTRHALVKLEQVIDWQYLCGEQYFQHYAPIDLSQMTRFANASAKTGVRLY